jgi:hypothetical protein
VLQQRGLAQARLADDEQAAAPAGPCALEQPPDRGDDVVAIDQPVRARRAFAGTVVSQADLPGTRGALSR